MQGLMASLLCAKDLSDSRKLNQSVLVITDNALLRWQVRDDHRPGWAVAVRAGKGCAGVWAADALADAVESCKSM